ncbi:hypothetical protein ACFQYP_23405 [Nonomuraea antimicrobica]
MTSCWPTPCSSGWPPSWAAPARGERAGRRTGPAARQPRLPGQDPEFTQWGVAVIDHATGRTVPEIEFTLVEIG